MEEPPSAPPEITSSSPEPGSSPALEAGAPLPAPPPPPSPPGSPPPGLRGMTVTLKISHLLAIAIAASFLAGFATHAAFFSAPTTVTASATGPAPATTAQTQAGQTQGGSGRVQVPNGIDDDYTEGNKDAKVQFIEFSDFQCPFCRRFYSQSLPTLKSEYIDTGKVLFAYRDFPLDSIHPGATPWAIAGECAKEQGKFRAMHDKIFDEQNKQGQGTISYPDPVSVVKQWAQEIGLDAGSFNICLDSQKHLSEVQKDLQDGLSAGVSGTPTFFIGSPQRGYTKITGAQPYPQIKQVIEAELAAA